MHTWIEIERFLCVLVGVALHALWARWRDARRARALAALAGQPAPKQRRWTFGKAMDDVVTLPAVLFGGVCSAAILVIACTFIEPWWTAHVPHPGQSLVMLLLLMVIIPSGIQLYRSGWGPE